MSAVQIVPRPARLAEGCGRPVEIADPLTIAADPELAPEVRWFRRVLEAATGFGVELVGPDEPVLLRLAVGELPRGVGGAAPPGAYRLDSRDGQIVVTGDSRIGVFYGLQTLRQLLPDYTLRRAPVTPRSPSPVVAVDAVVIEDWPRFEWRGLLLDLARHFIPKDFVLKLVDLAAFHKLNVVHLHLTDDQGWRVAVDRYPRLVEVGAWRRESPVGHAQEGRFDGIPHGGYYSREDLRELAAYAAERHVTVVPEVDMPGHMSAAIAAYPELGNSGRPIEVGTRWGVSPHVLNLEESTVRFCTDVVDEVADLFGDRYFHVGGDECATAEWETSRRGRALMADHGYTQSRQLQSWFTGRIAAHLEGRGTTLVGWEEIAREGAPPGTIVVPWRTDGAAAIPAVRSGHDVVMAPERSVYLDWAHADDPAEPLAIGGVTSVERVYAFEPVPAALGEEHRHRVLGAQCQLWTEYVATPARAEYQLFPRLCAFAETVWSPAEPGGAARSYAAFEPRLRRHLGRLAALGVDYRPLEGPTPGQSRRWRTVP
ncbi:MAG: beta-N-acetylhexosaminidase [Acidimicrobiales bacterium]